MEDVMFIYVLIDCRDNSIRYIGKTKNPKKRLGSHFSHLYSNSPKERWIKELRKSGGQLRMEIVDQCKGSESRKVEKNWYTNLIREGNNLLNDPSKF